MEATMRKQERRMRRVVLAVVVLGAVGLGCGGDGGTLPYPDVVDEGSTEADATCRPATEECNGRDDDCDGETDESWDLEADPTNCGECGNRCRFLNADGICSAGVCRLGTCREDYYDVNGDPEDGCEYRCILTTTGEDTWELCNDLMDNDCDGSLDFVDPDCQCIPEVCNHLDDDCDEEIDEGFDPNTDPTNCGECGVVCGRAWHAATPICTEGVCGWICDIGWVDANGWPDDGCEARCTPTGTADDDCDNDDDNCDGVINDGFLSIGCSFGVGGPGCAGFTDCRLTGTGYVEVCDTGRDVPEEDTTCDTIDDDCDGETDEDYRGVACGTGVCESFAPCVDGVETLCVPGTPLGPTDTTCDGRDDDCDGLTDEEYVPSLCGTGACLRTGMCILGREYCTAGIPEAERCDGIDNDCDAVTDDGFTCGAGASQACTLVVASKTCDGSQTCGATCAWEACVATPGGSNVESCNGIDDDCDTTVDEAPPAPATICPPAEHGTTGCTASTCVMTGCDDGWGDVNGSATDGCECATESPDAGNACGLARLLGTFPDTGWDVTVRGKLGSATDVDCYSLSATDVLDDACDNFHVDIRFTSNPSTQFQLDVFRGDCATRLCTAETSDFSWYTDYVSSWGPTGRGHCPCTAAPIAGFNTCDDDSGSFYFCVSRRTGYSPSCDEYVIRVTNGVFST
jgi:hypothetical protein